MNMRDAEPLSDSGFCFACGQDNPHGLAMKVYYEGEEALCDIELAGHFQGWESIAHGGVVSTVLDEIMSYAVIHNIGQAVTLKMEVRYRKPTPLGSPLLARGRVVDRKGRKVKVAGELLQKDGEKLLAQAEGLWVLKLDANGDPMEFKR